MAEGLGPEGSAQRQVYGRGAKRSPLPWLGQSPEIVSGIHHRRIGPARLLLDFYTQHQTDAHGRVWYGKAISYRWIAGRILECPPKRTLERWQRQLRENGYIETHTVVREGAAMGFTVRMLNQAKFNTRPAAIAGQQESLFDRPLHFPAHPMCADAAAKAVQKSVEKPVEKKISGGGVPSNLTGGTVKSVVVKEVIQKRAEGNNQHPRAETARDVRWREVREFRQRQKQRRILGEIELTRELYAGSGDPATLARRDRRLGELYDQLGATGWQDERAG